MGLFYVILILKKRLLKGVDGLLETESKALPIFRK
jgi:hypothetical protein